MPTKSRKETQEEQSARFIEEVQRLVDAGELNPTEADEALSALISKPAIAGKSDHAGE